jgi:AAA15 family ATPase/GTPase
MHPLIAEMIIKLFNDPEVNPKGAQLIFSTHNVTLMSNELLRRDQIWFAEKENGASTYFSLADFDKNIVKPKSPFNRWYLEGRFDAIPRIDYRSIVSILKSLRDSNAEEEG